MSRSVRLGVFGAGAVVAAVLYALAAWALPSFGGDWHPYGDRAVNTSLTLRHTDNVVSSVNFDQRAFDTLGEESILFGSVLGGVVLLRRAPDERVVRPDGGPMLPSTRMFGMTLLPVTLLTGVYVVAHGQLTPGGGFQGGVVLATGLHLLYIAADYRVLARLRPLTVFEVGDALGAAAFAVLGLAAMFAGAAFLANFLPYGSLGALASGGTVPLFNVAVGLEVGSGIVVLLAGFLDQALRLRAGRSQG